MNIESQRKKNEKFLNNIYKCKCKHCGSRFKTLKEVKFNISKNEFSEISSLYGALCHKCFYENLEVEFDDIIKHYTNRSEYEHEDFKEHEIDSIIDALILETEKNENLYKKFIKFKRDLSLNELGI